jgi:hypothetical protein
MAIQLLLILELVEPNELLIGILLEPYVDDKLNEP